MNILKDNQLSKHPFVHDKLIIAIHSHTVFFIDEEIRMPLGLHQEEHPA